MDSAVVMIRIAAVDVTAECDRDFAVAGVVGRIQYKSAQGLEVTLDVIEMAGRCRRRDQFDLVVGSPGTDWRRPVQRQVVVDQVDAQVIGIAPPDGLVERQDLGRALGQAIAAEQHVGVHVIGAEEVADTTLAHVSGPLASLSLALGVAVARIGLERNRSELIEAHHHAIRRTGAVQRHDACGRLLEGRVSAALPGAGSLERDVLLAQDAPQRLNGDVQHHSATFEVALQASP